MNALPPDLYYRIASHLNMNETNKLIQTCSKIAANLHLSREIIKSTRNHTIYQNKILLNIVYEYEYHKHLLIDWKFLKPRLDCLDIKKNIIIDHIIKFNDWEELEESCEYFEFVCFIGVVELLFSNPTLGLQKALICASAFGSTEIVLYLLKDGFDPSLYNNHALRFASQNGHLEIVRLLINDERVDPSDLENLFLGSVAENGHLEICRLFLKDSRVDPSVDDNFALYSAAENGHLKVVRLLLNDERVDPSGDLNHAILKSSENGHLDVVRLLIEDERVDPSDCNDYAIRAAAQNGHYEIVKLLANDSRVNPSNIDYAIVAASENGHFEIVRLLLEETSFFLTHFDFC